jgi:hypothetical protein
MKVSTKKNKTEFKPVKLKITFETREELYYITEFFANMRVSLGNEISGIGTAPNDNIFYDIYSELSNLSES